MKNPSQTKYDPFLKEIQQYVSYPSMMPFVGKDYDSVNHKKLLLLGESFYFPEESFIHKVSEQWYKNDQSSLSEEEIMYIHCRDLVQCDWQAAGHKMYREINGCLNSLGLEFEDRAISHISFTNTFLRPSAESGESFKHCCTDEDVSISVKVISEVIEKLKPDLVVFISKYSWDVVGWRITKKFDNVSFHFVSHPTDPFHWNVKSYPHGRDKFMTLLENDFLINEENVEQENSHVPVKRGEND